MNSTVLNSSYNGNCSQYEGICSIHLKKLTTVNDTLTTVNNGDITDQQLSEFFMFIDDFSSLISEKCYFMVMPFLCQYIYPPCNGNESSQFITYKQCVNIRDEACVSEWKFVMTTELGSLLPICEAFSNKDNFSFIMEQNMSMFSKCHYQFMKFCDLCLPLCDMFSQYPDQVKQIDEMFLIITAVFAIIGAIIVFFAAVVRRKEM